MGGTYRSDRVSIREPPHTGTSFALWKTRRHLLFWLGDKVPPRLLTRRRGSASFSRWKMRRRLVLQLRDEAPPSLPA
ncbi:hypothetical protein BHM03_00059943 [Ensete ventricosum]|nr:hypothetical protein BHM03_00059943 [Ensete ventricosum]